MRRALPCLLVLPLAAGCVFRRTDLPTPPASDFPAAPYAGCWEVRPPHVTLRSGGREHRSLAGVVHLSRARAGRFDVAMDAAPEVTYRAAVAPAAGSSHADTLFWVPRRDGFLLYWRAPAHDYVYAMRGTAPVLRGQWLLPGSHMAVALDSGIVATRLDSCP